MILFAAEKITLHYCGRPEPAFQDLSLTIRSGESLRLAGPSGSGKTSLLRLIAGLERPTAGRVRALPRRVGMAFAEHRLLPRLSVMENLLLVAPHAGQEAQDMLGALELGPLSGNLAEELSKGQAQRVALIRALIARPEILLLDEALGGLDPRTWDLTHDLILARRLENGFALVEISHDPARLIVPDSKHIALKAAG